MAGHQFFVFGRGDAIFQQQLPCLLQRHFVPFALFLRHRGRAVADGVAGLFGGVGVVVGVVGGVVVGGVVAGAGGAFFLGEPPKR